MQRLIYLDRIIIPPRQLLELSNWVEDLTQIQMEKLAPYFQAYSAEAGTMILKEGEPSGFFGLICEGAVDVVKESSSGRFKKLKTLQKGKAFGEMAFFDHNPSSTSIIVKERTILLIMEDRSFEALCADSPYIALKVTVNLIRTVSSRLRETSGKLIDLI
jgi:CRP/FNR family cyclic AMP-dependent transcriptional regulator